MTMDRPPPIFLASYAAAAIAGMGAIALQAAWPAARAGSSTTRGWQLPALLVAATAFLLATLISHMLRGRRRPDTTSNRHSGFAGLVCDLAVGLAAGATLAAGHRTAVVGQGLWIVPPILLAACAASALAGLFAWRENGLPHWRHRSELLRMVFAVIVVAFLAIQW
jgi:hypothetical protein